MVRTPVPATPEVVRTVELVLTEGAGTMAVAHPTARINRPTGMAMVAVRAIISRTIRHTLVCTIRLRTTEYRVTTCRIWRRSTKSFDFQTEVSTLRVCRSGLSGYRMHIRL
jgi:hypothetical protein